ncbi:MAG: AAA family ATPase [Deltaproteobacteria bacterium]|nr:AAA family ATPase [Deltaproteobacteria bacterium]
MNRTIPLDQLPVDLRIEDAVEAACARDLAFIEDRLVTGQSVLVECDKELVLHLTLALRARLKRHVSASGAKPPRMVIVDGRGGADDPPTGSLTRMVNQLGHAVRGAAERSVIVLPHLDVLTTTHTGLTMEAREAIPLLYENPDVCLLGFRDPSFDVPKVLLGVFAARREITGIPREALPQLITQREARALSTSSFDPFALYKFVSGQNPVRCRRLFADLAHRAFAPAGATTPAASVYADLRRQTAAEDVELPNVDLDRDVGGYAEVKSRLRDELIDLVARKDTLSAESDIKALEELLPRGVIFYGPPGTGKTFFAKAIATATSATVIVVSGPELKSKWVGESEENLRRVFRRARQAAPAVVVFDEIDAFATARGTYQGSGVEHSMVNQLLTEMDGFRKNEMVFVVGTTNLLSSVDPALLRPGRFEFLIEVPAPSDADRKAIVDLYDARMGLGLSAAVVAHLVRRTEDWADRARGLPYAGDHLYAACRALKRQQLRTGGAPLTIDDVDRALQRKTARPVVLSAHEERVIAIHESGHALLAMLVPGARPPEKVAIAQDRDGALGYVLRAAHVRPYATTMADMRAEICVGLGGTEAERLVLGDVSIGAHGDLQQCTRIARAMVESHGMLDDLGPRVLLDDGDRTSEQWSEQRRARVDDAVDGLLVHERRRAVDLLTEHRALLDELVALLLDKRVLDGSALATLRPRRATVAVGR